MSFHAEWIRFCGQQSGFLAFARRAAAKVPAVVVIQEAWGVDAHIEDVALRFAKAGYVALAPDLYAEEGERPEPLSRARMEELKAFVDQVGPPAFASPMAREAALAQRDEPSRLRLTESFGALFGGALGRLDAYLLRLLAAAHYLRAEHPLTRGAKVGAVGFCMGGALSARLACADPELSAAVIFYGTAPPPEQVHSIACPVLGLYGGLDARVNAGLEEFAAAMERHGKRFEHHVYPGAQHAFFNDTRPSYHAGAARDAFARALQLFLHQLS